MQKNRKPNRLKGFDYSSDSLYFITPVVKNRICYFGKIINDEMHLNELGKIVERQWFWVAEQYPYVNLHSFQVMPNHVHGIIEISRDQIGIARNLSSDNYDANRKGSDLSLQTQPIKIKSLSELMGAYQMTASKHIHLLQNGGADYENSLLHPSEFTWQRSFHDHIIMSQKSFEIISDYIETNPQNWKDDRFFR